MAPICDDSLCFSTPTAGYVVACTWTWSGHTWQLTGPTVLLKLCWHPEFWSSFINKHSLLMQTEAVVHCQIQQQTITCCNAELSLSNHRYIATWTLDGKNIWQNLRWSFGVHYLHLKNVGSMLLTIQHEITPLFLLMFDIKHKKNPPFFNKHFKIARKNLRGDANITPLRVTALRREKYYTKQFSKVGRSGIG